MPTTLPAAVSIAGDARVEAGTSAHFVTDLKTTQGLAFHWDFGDGSAGSSAAPSHAYATPGIYEVTLAVANQAQDLRTASATIRVGAYANVEGLNCTQADSGGWCWQHAIVTGHQINDVFFLDASHAWAVGDYRTILKSADAGTTWSQAALDALPQAASLGSVRFLDAMHGMALTDQAEAVQTSDGGSTWATRSLNGPTWCCRAGHFVEYTADRIVAQDGFGFGGSMSVDGGLTWTAVAATGTLFTAGADCWSIDGYLAQRAPGCGPTGRYPCGPVSAMASFRDSSPAASPPRMTG